MDRKQAVTVIKEIVERCPEIEGRSITLLPPKNNDALSNTFQMHLRDDDPILESYITNIAKEHGLDICQDENYLVVYKPHPELKNNKKLYSNPARVI